jgi:hypothetical protein
MGPRFRTKNRLEVLHLETSASAVNQSLKDLLHLASHAKQEVATVFPLVDREPIAEVAGA